MTARGTVRRFVLLAGFLALLGSCQPPPASQQSFPDLRFTVEPPLGLDVATIEVVQSYRPALDPAHVEERLPVPLPHVLANWAHDRFQAVGTRGTARITILEASATATPLAKQQGFSAQFTAQADTRYDMHAAVTVEILDERGFPVRTANATAERSYASLEDMTLAERERELYRVEGELMADLDRQVTDEVRSTFAPHLQ